MKKYKKTLKTQKKFEKRLSHRKKTNKKKNKLRTIEPYQPAIWEHTEFGKRIDVAEVGTEPDFPRSSPG